MEEDQEADDHAHEGMKKKVSQLAAHVAQLGGVAAKPFRGRLLDLAVAQELVEEGGLDPEAEELGAGLVQDVGDLLEERGQVADRPRTNPISRRTRPVVAPAAKRARRARERSFAAPRDTRGVEEGRSLVQQGVDDEAGHQAADEAEVEEKSRAPAMRIQAAFSAPVAGGRGTGAATGCGHVGVRSHVAGIIAA